MMAARNTPGMATMPCTHPMAPRETPSSSARSGRAGRIAEKASTPIPVIVITGVLANRKRFWASQLEDAPEGFLTKPIKMNELAVLVKRLTARTIS